jgi:hypothetical protein
MLDQQVNGEAMDGARMRRISGFVHQVRRTLKPAAL